MPHPQMSQEGSWQSLHHSEASADNDEDSSTDVSMEDEGGAGEETMQVEEPSHPTINDIRKAMHPLRTIADRVGQQVEDFAKSLDRISSKAKKEVKSDCRSVLPYIKEYHKIASNTVKSLQATHTSEKKQRPTRNNKSRSRRSSAKSPGAGALVRTGSEGRRLTTIDDLKTWEEEEQTWDLFGRMLQVHYPASEKERPTLKPKAKDASMPIRPQSNLNLHKFSPERDVWDNFLATDDLAWERYTVLEWLKNCADKSGPEIDDIVEELESEADRGSGLWAHSWLYTKEAIKGQKRLRSWPQALEPNSPGLDTSLVGSTRKSALVSQLDPDAISRQGRELEKQDHSFERAIWVACWEMLRRGKDWSFVQNWCQDRGELWRSTAMRSDLHFQSGSSADWQSRYLWRKACAVAAKSGGNDDYEKAVYGILSGYMPSVLSIGRGWDDYLFAHYNSYLFHSFERHLKNHHPDRLMPLSSDVFKFSAFSGQRALSGNQIVEKMKCQQEIKEEALQPLKMLQGALIAGNFDNFIVRHGVRLSRVANAEAQSKIISPLPVALLEGAQTAPITMQDYDLLRILTHMILVFANLGHKYEDQRHQYAVDSIIVAYIDFLSKAGKQQLIPLYASHLSSKRIINCMSRQLPYVLNVEERKIMMKLMTKYGIDVPAVLAVQLHSIMDDPLRGHQKPKSFPQLQILDRSKKSTTFPQQIKPHFIGKDVTDEQYDLIHGLEWFMLLDGHWVQSMFYGAEVYKYFLQRGALAAARELSRIVTFSKFSHTKSQALIGKVADISQDLDFSDDESNYGLPVDLKSRHWGSYKSKPNGAKGPSRLRCEILMTQGRTFLDFEQLLYALDAIEVWKEHSLEAERYTNRQQDRQAWNERRVPFTKAFEEVEEKVNRLFHEWLQTPRNDTEAKDFRRIRVACLPEIILAYNSILDFSSRYISRNLLLSSMNLATTIAAKDSELSTCFMEAGRMPELMDSFARLSKNIILADGSASAGSKASRKNRDGQNLEVWTVKAPDTE